MIKMYLQKESVQAGLICIFLIFLALGIQLSSFYLMKEKSIILFESLNKADSIQKEIAYEALQGNELKIITLKRQYQIASEIKTYYRDFGTSYYLNYYSFSICAIIFTILLSIAVFLIANKGWSNSGIVLRAFLLSSIAISSAYYFLPQVLSNKENLSDIVAKIKEFQKIQSDIMSVSVQLKQIDEKKTDSLISDFFNRISNNIDFPTAIDDSKIHSEMADLRKMLNTSPKTPVK